MDFVELTSNYAMKSIFVLDTTDWMIAGIIAFIAICVVTRMVQQKRICITQAVAAVLLATYLFLIFDSTVIARSNRGMHSYQLQPFWSYKEVIENGRTDLLSENLLNVGILVPVGFLLPLLSRRIRCRHVIFAAFLISYTIEFSQLIFCKGLFELVDDPFHNVLGAIVGYGIYRVARQIATGQGNKRRFKYFFVAIALVIAYAISDEIHQYFVPGRVCQVKDICIDAAGAMVGATIWWTGRRIMLAYFFLRINKKI